MEFNFNKIKKILPIFFILILLYLTFILRAGPIDLDNIDPIVENSVRNNLVNILSNEVNQNYPNIQDVYKQELILKKLDELETSGKVILSNGEVIDYDSQVLSLKNRLRESFKSDYGGTYLNAIDPYYFYRLAEIYSQNGFLGTKKISDNKSLIEYRNAPVGITTNPNNIDFHSLLISKIFDFFNLDESSTDGEKMSKIFLIPIILSMLCVIPIYFIIRKFSDDYSAFFGTAFLVSVGTFVSRTIGGFVDTDGYNVLLPLLIIVFLVYSIDMKNTKLKILLVFLSSFFMGLFTYIWGPSYFIFIFLFISFLAFFLYKIFLFLYENFEKNKFKKINLKVVFKGSKNKFSEEVLFLMFLVFSNIFTFIFSSKDLVYSGFKWGVTNVLNLGQIQELNIWANVSSSIAELNKMNFTSILNSVGGEFGAVIFLFSFMSIILINTSSTKFENLLFFKSFKSKIKNYFIAFCFVFYFLVLFGFSKNLNLFSQNSTLLFILFLMLPIILSFIFCFFSKNFSFKILFTILLTIWLFGTIYMSINGVRFILLLATPLSILFGIFFFYFMNFINFVLTKTDFKVDKSFVKKGFVGLIISVLTFSYIFYPIYTSNKNISNYNFPNFDDTWFNMMYKIKNESKEDSVITSWWDFGHFFAATSKRGVTFDGGSQSGWTANFVGKLLLEKPDVSYEILKMLQCSHSRGAYDYMHNITNDSSVGINLIYDVLYESFNYSELKDKKRVIENYKYYNFTEGETNKILSLIACDNPKENYLILSEDMVGKSGVWTHWGTWNYYKKYTHDNREKLSLDEISNNLNLDTSTVQIYLDELRDIDDKVKYGDFNREDLTNSWFSNYPSYIPQLNTNCVLNDNLIECENGMRINSTDLKVLNTNLNQEFFISNLFYFGENSSYNKVVQSNKTNLEKGFDLVLTPSSQNTFRIYAMANPLGESLFTRGFFLGGVGIEDKFELYDFRQDIMGQRIYIYKVNWDN